jgi:hypothetical protein
VVIVWRAGANGTMVETQRLAGPMDGYGTLVDVDADGRPDLLAVDGQNQVTVLHAGADGKLGAPVTSALVSSASLDDYQLGDVDGDGRLDLVAQTTSLLAFHGLGDGTFLPTPVEIVQGSFSVFAVGHFDDDDLLDFAVVDRDLRTLQVWRGRGLGPARNIQSSPLGEVPGLVYSGDVDGNGRTDLVLVGTPSGGAGGAVLLSHKDGKMSSPVPLPVQGKGIGLLQDVNGDGRADFLFHTGLDQQLKIFTSRTPTRRP